VLAINIALRRLAGNFRVARSARSSFSELTLTCRASIPARVRERIGISSDFVPPTAGGPNHRSDSPIPRSDQCQDHAERGKRKLRGREGNAAGQSNDGSSRACGRRYVNASNAES